MTDHDPAELCPGAEADPNTCRCPCEGCRYHCAAHVPPGMALLNPERGKAWAGMDWDAEVEAWVVKDAPDGRRVWVMPFMFTSAVIIGPPDAWTYDDRWCYATAALAATHARAWPAEPGTEPAGWHRHPNTGRRRPDGDPAREHLMP